MSEIERDARSCPHGTFRWVLVLQLLSARISVSNQKIHNIVTTSLTILQSRKNRKGGRKNGGRRCRSCLSTWSLTTAMVCAAARVARQLPCSSSSWPGSSRARRHQRAHRLLQQSAESYMKCMLSISDLFQDISLHSAANSAAIFTSRTALDALGSPRVASINPGIQRQVVIA